MKRKPPVYDRMAAHYDGMMRPLERFGLGALRAAALREVPDGARMLEVGVGTGANFRFYPRDATSCACIEPSREMLMRACARPERPTHALLLQSVAERLPFGDDAFDAAFATLVFCSVASPQSAFAELRRVVRVGGAVVLLEHVRPRALLGYAFDALSLLTVPLFEDHFNRRTGEEARRAGLEITRIENHLFGSIQLITGRVV